VRYRLRSKIRVSAAMLPLLLLWTPIATPAAQAAAADASVTLTVLAPSVLVDVTGTHEGSVDSLATRDQAGTADDPSRYVRLRGAEAGYVGYRTYTLPSEVAPSSVTTITLTANFRGPIAAVKRWTWAIYDATHDAWIRLGTQDHCGGDAGTEQWPCDDLDRAPWKSIRLNVIRPVGVSLTDVVDPATGEIRVRLVSRAPGSAKLDWEVLEIYSNDGVIDAPWAPPVGARWQWQLQGAPGRHLSTGGIAVGICQPPFRGADCVRPDVFDFDLYVDPSIAGRYGWVVETAAVDAVHASGRHAIGYVTAGDAERWRPDYQQFVDFDRRCGGCLLGEPFSRRFPDEYWANFSYGKGRFGFMLQMLRARTDRVAATGFDGIEYDIVDTYAQGKQTTGFRVDADTQLAYNIALAEMAHADGLSVALKNDGAQIADLLPYFDYAINEQCFQYHECDGGGYPAPAWRAFIDAGKPVFQAEYRLEPKEFCRTANRWDFSSIAKSPKYNLYALPWMPCR
jgi:endo-alpha-1,4-polygalactosaminidase (GH114 family)